MKILLTGAHGNLGRELRKTELHNIVSIGRSDWNDLDARVGGAVDAVIHAASDLRTSMNVAPVAVLNSNIMSTARALEAAKRHRIPRFIFISSCAVYGDEKYTSEDARCSPVSINGICKLLNEKVISEFCQGTSIKYTILRVFNMYGGDDHFSIFRRIANALENNTPLLLNNQGLAYRDFIHVTDVSNCILKLLDVDVPFSHLNIGTGIATRISDIVNIIQARHPALRIQHEHTIEADYSCADVARLLRLVRHNFVDVEYYVKSKFFPDD